MATSYFLHSPLHHHFLFPPPSSSSSLPLSSRPPLFLYLRNAEGKRRSSKNFRAPPMAALNQRETPQDIDSYKRRALLILGISVFPLLPWKNEAFANGNEEGSGKENQDNEQIRQRSPSSNPFLSLLNVIGLLGSGVLAALYSLARKDKATSEAMIESLNCKLKEKDAAIVSLEKNFESKLSYQQEEQSKLLNKAKEEQLSLVNHLELANNTIAGLGKELKGEKQKIEQLQVDIGDLGVKLEKAGKENDSLEERVKEKDSAVAVLQERVYLLSSEVKEKEETIQGLNSSLALKDSELTEVNSSYMKTKDEVEALKSQIMNLNEDLLKQQSDLEQKHSMLDDLNASVDSLTVERNNLITKLKTLEHKYDDLRSSSTKKAAEDRKLLEERESELNELKEKCKLLAKEDSVKEALLSDLTQDRDILKKMFDIEAKSVQSLKQELQQTKEALELSKVEASDLNKLLKDSKKLSSELEAELSKVQAEFSIARESLQKSLNEATLQSETLVGELSVVKEALNRTKKELEIVSKDLTATSTNCDSLQKELAEENKKAESAINDLREERKMVATLSNEVQTLENQILKDIEARTSLETKLNEATKSLDEMTRQSLILSNDLKVSNSQISSLEEERDFLNNSLEKEKKIVQDAQENLEDAQSVIMRLGTERENLQKKARKLEEDLASAKGEILRLRAEVNSSKNAVNSKLKQQREPTVIHSESEEAESQTQTVNNEAKQEAEPAVNTTAASAKKTTRRRKTSTGRGS